MDGTATIEIAPTYPEFAVQHAAKKNMHSSLATPMPSQVFSAYPIQYIPSLPSQYCMVSKESLMSVSNFNDLSQSQLPILNAPNIKEFLEKLDKDEGNNGEFTQFIDVFNEQKISVKHIKDLSDDEFQILGVTAIGWRKTIRAAANQYR